MFNYNTLQSEMASRTIPTQALNLMSGAHARLFVFTPSVIPTQVLRPYKYNFTQNLVDQLVSTDTTMQRTVAPDGFGEKSYDMLSAILPDQNGIVLNTHLMSTQWTFVLIIDSYVTPSSVRTALNNPVSRIICAGYCTDEPIDLRTSTPNYNAMLMFTKTNTTRIMSSIGVNGASTQLANHNDLDIVNETIAQIANQNLMIGTPKDISNNVDISGDGQMIGAYGSCDLSNMKAEESGKMINGVLKTPMIQLGAIAKVIDSSINAAQNADEIASSINMPQRLNDPLDVFKSTFRDNIYGSDDLLPRQSFDSSRPISIGQLCNMFGDVDIQPYQIPPSSSWDVTPQDTQTKRNAMSSMITASLTNLLPSCSLATITFRFNSFAGMSGFGLGDPNGVWDILNYGMLVESTPAQQKASINYFKQYFTSELLPVIRTYGGEFDVMVHADMMGHMLVDLHFLDENSIKSGEGFYETSAKFGGFLNPMVTDQATFMNNAGQLNALLDMTGTRKLGQLSLIGNPIINSNEVDRQYTIQNSMSFPNQMYPQQNTAQTQIVQQQNLAPSVQIQQPSYESDNRQDFTNLI